MIEYEDAIIGIMSEIERLQDITQKEAKKALKKIGQSVSANVSMTAPVSDEKYIYSRGQKKENTHIADDVVYKVKKARGPNAYYVSISGGKKTWGKWHLASDGHIAENGRYVQGNHFVEKSIIKSEEQITSILNEFLEEVIRD